MPPDASMPGPSKNTGIRLALTYAAIGVLSIAFFRFALLAMGWSGILPYEIGAAVLGIFAGALAMFFIGRNMARPLENLTQEIEGGRRKVADLTAANAAIREQVDFDPVTGLPSQEVFLPLLTQALNAERSDGGALLHVEIIDLRRIVRTFGDETANAVLAAAAERLLATSPIGTMAENRKRAVDSDHVGLPALGRTGSQDFLLHLPGTSDSADLVRHAAFLHAAFHRPLSVGERRIPVNLAVGVARYPDETASASGLVDNAALAAAQAALLIGPDRTRLFDPAMREARAERDLMERELRQAIVNGEIAVHYQPRISTGDWSLAGAEALVRWRHPERGLLMPEDFMPTAEETGLVVELGQFVIDQAVAQCAAWARVGRLTEMAVNVSPVQLHQSDFSERLLRTIHRHGCLPALVTLEISESLALGAIGVARGHMTTLQAAGVKFAIDDFGTGYANLGLRTAPGTSILKVDRPFVAGLESDGPSRQISRSIVELGKALGCRIVAVGAETPGQIATASSMGCEEIQGYYVARPMVLEEFEDWQIKRGQSNLSRIVKSIFGPDFGEGEAEIVEEAVS